MKQDLIEQMVAAGVLPVFRTNVVDRVIPASRAFYDAGVRVIEYAMTMPDAAGLLKKAARELPADAVLCAGTVLDVATAQAALEAGARFLVAPSVVPEVMAFARPRGVPVVFGAITPTEITQALRLEAAMIKLFPANNVPPVCITELLGPFPRASFMVAGGVTLESAGAYIRAGAKVVTQAGQGMNAAAFASGDYGAITRTARQFLDVIRRARENA